MSCGHLLDLWLCNMSFFNAQDLLSASDDRIPSENREPQAFTTAEIAHDTLLEFQRIAKAARIINDDSINNLTYRLHSNRGIARIVPAASEITINEWFSIIIVTPNATTGAGQLELELVNSVDARRRSR